MMLTLGPGPLVIPSLAQQNPVGQPETVVLLAFGQSNMVDQSSNDATQAWPANVLAMDPELLTYAPAASPIRWLERNPGATGDWQTGPGQLVKQFAIDWAASHPDDTMIVVPGARSATGFLEGNWIANGNGVMFNETQRLLDRVFADYPQARFLAMLAQHGERDAENENRCYLWNALEMVARWRDRYTAPTLPVIWGEPGPAAQFESTTGAGYDAVRSQIRSLPARLPYSATARSANPTAFDALTDLDGMHFDQASQQALGGLHHDALATAQTNSAAPLGDVALIYQTAGEQGFLNFDIPCHDLAVGDTLVVLASTNRGSGSPFINTLSINGDAGTVHLQQMTIQGARLGQSVASVTLSSAIPASELLNVLLTWQANPSGGSLSVWRVRTAPAFAAGSITQDAALGALSVSLTAGLPGAVLVHGYALHTGGEVTFAGDGTALVEGPTNGNSSYFTTRETSETGATATLSLTPSVAPNRVCGLIAVALG